MCLHAGLTCNPRDESVKEKSYSHVDKQTTGVKCPCKFSMTIGAFYLGCYCFFAASP